MPNIRKISRPATANDVNTMKHVNEAFNAILLRRFASAPEVMAINEGMAANGSTRKKIELKARTENRT